jgi:hypothetical protein
VKALSFNIILVPRPDEVGFDAEHSEVFSRVALASPSCIYRPTVLLSFWKRLL